MIRALYTAASGMLLGMRSQDVAAGNLSNSNTVGYKAESAATSAFEGVLARRVGGASTPAPIPVSLDQPLGRVGTGVYQSERARDARDGTQRATDEPFDVALSGPGFFAVETPEGVQYTRDGNFGRSSDGRLVTVEGYSVLDADGQAINVPAAGVRITAAGEVLAGETPLATLQVVEFDIDGASRAGYTRFVPNDAVTAADLGGATSVHQGRLEEANVDLARTATTVISVARAYEASQQVFSTVNATLEQSVTQVGRVG